MPIVRGAFAGAAAFAVAVVLSGAGLAEPVAMPAHQKAAEAPVEQPLAADIHETFVRVPVELTLPNGKPYAGEMVITHFRPAGPGPFPVVVFSHGRTPATRHEPVRWRALPTARYWTRRGFAVMVPTRVGYGELGQTVDPEASGTCSNADFRPAVAAMAAQVARTVEFARTLSWTDPGKVILSGVSYGGFATIGATAKAIPGVIGAINFVGGLGGNPQARPGEPCQGPRITAIVSEAGAASRTPALWLYAENDLYWGKEWPQRWYDAYTAAGGNAKLVNFPPVGEDGHKLMSQAFTSWRPVVDRFVASLGFKLPLAATKLAASDFAALDDVEKVPHIRAAARTDGYTKFLAADVPRAFAIAPSGAWAWRSGLDAVEVALSRCQTNARGPCSLYAVDDRVVWKPQSR